MKSYWDSSTPCPSWTAPSFPPEGLSSLAEAASQTSSQIIYIQDNELECQRRKMLLPFAENSPQNTFFRAPIRLTCCEPLAEKTVDDSNLNDAGLWNDFSGFGGRFGDFVPGLRGFSGKTAEVYQWVRNLPVFDALHRLGGQSDAAFSQSRFRDKSAVRALSWHPSQTTLAFADGLDAVILCSCDKLFPSTSGIFSKTLTHLAQKHVLTIIWDSFCEFRLGICCLKSIVIWDVNPQTVRGMEAPLWTVSQSDEDAFTAMLFTSSLSFLAATQHGKLRDCDLFDPETEQFLSYGGISQLNLSPNRSFVAYSDSRGFIGMMKEDGLDNLTHLHSGGSVTALTWLPSSTAILFSLENSTEICLLPVRPPPNLPGTPPKCHEIAVVGSFRGNEEDAFFGAVNICSMSLDRSGRRLVVILQNKVTLATRCLLCATETTEDGGFSVMRLSGWMVLPKDDVPIFATFPMLKTASEQHLAVLTVASRGGEIAHFPVQTHSVTPVESPSQEGASTQLETRPAKFLLLHMLSSITRPLFQWLRALVSGNHLSGAEYQDKGGFTSDLADMTMYRPSPAPSVSRITTFIENKATKPEKADRLGDFLNRTLSPTPEREVGGFSTDRSSDHHMSVDRSPDPAWKPQNPLSPLAAQIAGLSVGNGEQSRPSYTGYGFPLTRSTRTSEGVSDGMGLPSRLKFSE